MEMTEHFVLEPEKMTPTDRAPYYYGFRAHLQILT